MKALAFALVLLALGAALPASADEWTPVSFTVTVNASQHCFDPTDATYDYERTLNVDIVPGRYIVSFVSGCYAFPLSGSPPVGYGTEVFARTVNDFLAERITLGLDKENMGGWPTLAYATCESAEAQAENWEVRYLSVSGYKQVATTRFFVITSDCSQTWGEVTYLFTPVHPWAEIPEDSPVVTSSNGAQVLIFPDISEASDFFFITFDEFATYSADNTDYYSPIYIVPMSRFWITDTHVSNTSVHESFTSFISFPWEARRFSTEYVYEFGEQSVKVSYSFEGGYMWVDDDASDEVVGVLMDLFSESPDGQEQPFEVVSQQSFEDGTLKAISIINADFIGMQTEFERTAIADGTNTVNVTTRDVTASYSEFNTTNYFLFYFEMLFPGFQDSLYYDPKFTIVLPERSSEEDDDNSGISDKVIVGLTASLIPVALVTVVAAAGAAGVYFWLKKRRQIQRAERSGIVMNRMTSAIALESACDVGLPDVLAPGERNVINV